MGRGGRVGTGVEGYLGEVERRARGALGREAARVTAGEAEARLRESIVARLELGDDPSVAELDALAALGPPRKAVGPRLARHRARFRPLFLGGTLASGAGLAVALANVPALGLEASVVAGAAFLASAWSLAVACERPRP